MTTSLDQGTCPLAESELRDLLLAYRRENWRGIQSPELQERLVEDLIYGDAENPLRQVEPYVRISENSRILDLGSGVGSFVVACRKRGLHAFGVEPDRIGQGANLNSIQIARRRVSSPVFVSAVGEKLPFPDGCFDLVVMNQVIEHVSDQQQVVREAARVVRQGGIVYAACPNYLRFYEPHYKIFWLPLMPKWLGRWYLYLIGRSPAMLSQLTYTTHRRLKKLLAAIGPGYTVLDIHREEFLRKRGSNSFAARSTNIVRTLTYLPVVGRLVLTAVLWYASVTEGGCVMLLIRQRQGTTGC